MSSDELNDRGFTPDIEKISEFMDGAVYSRITGKITDYSDILTEQKLISLINFKYDLSSTQVNSIIALLLKTHAISLIYTIATKGMRDLEAEYISNIFSRPDSPATLSSYATIRTMIENRLTGQVQNYNINMNKPSSTLAIPVSELRSHVKSHAEMQDTRGLKSPKIQHGMISASLHDAMVTLLNSGEWWNDKSFTKFFIIDSGYPHAARLLLSKSEWFPLARIRNISETIPLHLDEIIGRRNLHITAQRQGEGKNIRAGAEVPETPEADDKMIMTPFGKQYGGKIDSLIAAMFSDGRYVIFASLSEDMLKKNIAALSEACAGGIPENPDPALSDALVNLGDFLISGHETVKSFSEKYLPAGRKSPATAQGSESREKTEEFLMTVFLHFFEIKFASLFKIIKSQDLKKFACAYILKRIQLKNGESLTPFGHTLIRAIGRSCGMKA